MEIQRQDFAIDPKIDKMVNRIIKIADIIKSQTEKRLLTVVIFDLSESTSGKIKEGHDIATKKVMIFNEICNIIVKIYDGKIVKNLGDGTLAKFYNPISACLAAINIIYFSKKNNLAGKAVLTLGMAEEIKISDREDILGSCVDKCFRIEDYAIQEQILIDDSLYNSVYSFLAKFKDLEISEWKELELKGLGKERVYEIKINQALERKPIDFS